MKKPVLCTLLILMVLMTISGCSIKHNVNTDSVKTFRKDLMEITHTIKSVDITFMRPSVTYKVNMTKEPTQEVLDAVLAKSKSFTTVDNMDKIAAKVRWQQHISRVYLRIDIDDDDAVEYEYSTSYYKTARVEDIEGNIDAYQTWNQTKIQKIK